METPRRGALKAAVCALCTEVGFSHADEAAVETLTEMMQSYLTEMGRSGKAFAELACRTEPMLSDIIMAAVEMGSDVNSLPAYSRRPNKMFLVPPETAKPTLPLRTLQAGPKQSHPSHIPDHLPAFPDSHTYIKTNTLRPPVTEYQQIREKAATQKRDVERALTQFIAKTGETENLFSDDPFAFSLIACKPKQLPYLDALLPKDQDLDAQEDQEMTEKMLPPQEEARRSEEPEAADNSLQKSTDVEPDSETLIDNPYLRPIKMPSKLKGNKLTKKFF